MARTSKPDYFGAWLTRDACVCYPIRTSSPIYAFLWECSRISSCSAISQPPGDWMRTVKATLAPRLINQDQRCFNHWYNMFRTKHSLKQISYVPCYTSRHHYARCLLTFANGFLSIKSSTSSLLPSTPSRYQSPCTWSSTAHASNVKQTKNWEVLSRERTAVWWVTRRRWALSGQICWIPSWSHSLQAANNTTHPSDTGSPGAHLDLEFLSWHDRQLSCHDRKSRTASVDANLHLNVY